MSSASVERKGPRFKGPGEIVLAAAIARRFYLDERTKVEIADEFDLTRFKVARLLALAREQGMVRIEIELSGTIDLERSIRLRERFGLKHAVVIDAPDDDVPALLGSLGQATAELLTEVMTPDDTLGLAWARSVQSTVKRLRRLPPIRVVQLTGALTRLHGTSSSIAGDSSVDIVRDVARISGGPAHLFFAPFLVADRRTAETLRRQADVALAHDMAAGVTVAAFGIGHWSPGRSTLYDAATERERVELTRQGVCAEIAGICLNADGEILETSLNLRMLGADPAQLRCVPQVVAIPYGIAKLPAVLAALRSGLVSIVVTHHSLADALLAEPAAALPPS